MCAAEEQVVINVLFCEIFLHLRLTSDGLGDRLYLASLVWCKWYSVISKWGICGGCVCSWGSLTTCGIWYVPVHKSHPWLHAFIPPQLKIHCSAFCFEVCLSVSWIPTKSSLTRACGKSAHWGDPVEWQTPFDVPFLAGFSEEGTQKEKSYIRCD